MTERLRQRYGLEIDPESVNSALRLKLRIELDERLLQHLDTQKGSKSARCAAARAWADQAAHGVPAVRSRSRRAEQLFSLGSGGRWRPSAVEGGCGGREKAASDHVGVGWRTGGG